MKTVVEEFRAGEGAPASRLMRSTVQVSPGLGSDRQTLPANGSTPATFHYQRKDPAETTVVVTVNGAVQAPMALDGTGAVEFEVTAAIAGPVEVTASGDTITLTAG